MSAHPTWFGRVMVRSRSKQGQILCSGWGTVVFGRWQAAASPILAISRRILLQPTTWPRRRRWRAIWRLPYQGVSRNCSSISRISFSALSPFRGRQWADRLMPTSWHCRPIDSMACRGSICPASGRRVTRPVALRRKSRSTTSWPILAWSLSISLSLSAATASPCPRSPGTLVTTRSMLKPDTTVSSDQGPTAGFHGHPVRANRSRCRRRGFPPSRRPAAHCPCRPHAAARPADLPLTATGPRSAARDVSRRLHRPSGHTQDQHDRSPAPPINGSATGRRAE